MVWTGTVHTPAMLSGSTATSTPAATYAGLPVADMVTEGYNKTEGHKSYTFTATYPESSLHELPEVYAYIQSIKTGFFDDYQTVTDKEAQLYTAEWPYELNITTKVATSSKTVTYIIETYQYEGGAHGGTSESVFTYDASGKLVTLDRVFSKPYLQTVSLLARDYFTKTLGDNSQPQMIESGTEATAENYSEWYLTDSAIVFIFGQYQIGPYVLGIQEFVLPKSKIQDILSAEFK